MMRGLDSLHEILYSNLIAINVPKKKKEYSGLSLLKLEVFFTFKTIIKCSSLTLLGLKSFYFAPSMWKHLHTLSQTLALPFSSSSRALSLLLLVQFKGREHPMEVVHPLHGGWSPHSLLGLGFFFFLIVYLPCSWWCA